MQSSKKVLSDDSNLWLISYSDLITAILSVLVLVMSFSKIDIEKVDHANRLMKNKNLLTLPTLKKEYKKIIKNNNLEKYISVSLEDDGLIINMATVVQFKVNSAKINKANIDVLKPVLSQIIKNSTQREIIIIGHTDNSGTRVRNWELSSQRANAMMLYLMKKGMNDKHAHIVAYGSNKPIDMNNTNSAKNRRVSIIIGRSYEQGKLK